MLVDIKEQIAKEIKNGKNVALYCYGIQAEYLITWLGHFHHVKPICIIDNDPRKKGQTDENIPILPYEEAKNEYQELSFFICSDDFKYTIIGRLLEKGEKPENIINYVPVEKRKGCLYFSNRLLLVQGSDSDEQHYLVHCNADSFKKQVLHTDFRNTEGTYSNAHEQLLNTYNRFAKDEIEECRSCVLNHEQYLVKESYKEHYKALAFYQKSCSDCLASCVYCCVGGNSADKFKAKYDDFDRYKVFVKRILKLRMLDRDFTCSFDVSERDMDKKIAVGMECLKECDYFPLVIKINSCLITYNDKIGEMMKKGLCYIIWSLDSGNRATYRKIKQIDAFERSVETVKKYLAEDVFHGKFIIPKYLIVKGINDTDEEFDSFLKLIIDLGLKNVSLSYDFYSSMEENDAAFIRRCYEKIVSSGLCLTYKNNSRQITEALNMNNILSQ